MRFNRFSEWMSLREQQASAPPAAPKAPGSTPAGNSAVDAQLKKVIGDTATQPKKVRDAKLAAMLKQKQSDPKTTPKDMKAIADVISAP
jgi:hypothetical protein